MSDNWLREYVLLAFRIHRVVQTVYGSQFVEAYYGPPEWRQQAESEPELSAANLVRQTMTLADALPAQEFASQRASYLAKHVIAMETLCRKLCGEPFPLEEEAKCCLDISPVWTPEEQFEQAHALYEMVLPGTGSIAERLKDYKSSLAFPLDQVDVLKSFIDQAFVEARKRTLVLMELPAGETIEVQYLPEKAYDAAARYDGNYRTRIEVNVVASAAELPRLFDHKVCHEAYPGHHTEYVLKEQYLYQQQGYIEQALVLTLCPQCVNTEGIAMMAHEMIFSPGEAEQWIAEHIYPFLHKEVDATILLRLRQASEMLFSVWDNALMLLDEGRSEAEVAQYFMRYMLVAEDKAVQMVAHLKHPVDGLYTLTYVGGQKLLRPWLQGPDRVAVFRHFLKKQINPSSLVL
ncbi:MAG TPA: hypothetical protein VKU38_12280 [Ktedonobacteraceae bacterium]|nr:hypothetical protein [Ktedonobacteraceae bacterium]